MDDILATQLQWRIGPQQHLMQGGKAMQIANLCRSNRSLEEAQFPPP